MNSRFGEFVSNTAMPPNVCIGRELQTGARQCVPNATNTQGREWADFVEKGGLKVVIID